MKCGKRKRYKKENRFLVTCRVILYSLIVDLESGIREKLMKRKILEEIMAEHFTESTKWNILYILKYKYLFHIKYKKYKYRLK